MSEVREIKISSEEFKRAMEHARKQIAAWPAWKRETRASSIQHKVYTEEEIRIINLESKHRHLKEIKENNLEIKRLQNMNKMLRSFIKE